MECGTLGIFANICGQTVVDTTVSNHGVLELLLGRTLRQRRIQKCTVKNEVAIQSKFIDQTKITEKREVK